MSTRLDQRDIEILALLCREGRLSKTELARRVNLSDSPCAERLRRLEAAGIVRGYHADIALEKLGPHVEVFVVTELGSHRAEDFRMFEHAVEQVDAIIGCWAVGGGVDYLLHVVTTDIAAYQSLIDALLEREIGLARYFSYIVTKSVKLSRTPPIAALFSHGNFAN